MTPIGNRKSPQWDPVWCFGTGQAPVKRAIVALFRRAKLALKMLIYLTHRNGPILGAKAELSNLMCTKVEGSLTSIIDCNYSSRSA